MRDAIAYCFVLIDTVGGHVGECCVPDEFRSEMQDSCFDGAVSIGKDPVHLMYILGFALHVADR